MTEEMVCRELVEQAGEYLEGGLSAADRRRFEAHLEECPYCIEYLDQIQAVSGALGGLEEEPLPPAARDSLLAAYRGRRTPP